jgi:hypothetical protein
MNFPRRTPVPVASLVRGFEGKWVALKGGEVVAARETPDAVYRDILEHSELRGATIIRVPDLAEPELIGLG